MKSVKQALCVAPMIAVIALAACGKHQDKATMPVSAMVDNPHLLNAEEVWCVQQSHPNLIEGCVHADTADWFNRNPDKLALVKKPEPWPGKTTEFFQDAWRAHTLQESSPNGVPVLPKIKSMVDAVPANERNAYDEEAAWCGAQASWNQGSVANNKTDLSKISPTCGALQKVQFSVPFVNPFS